MYTHKYAHTHTHYTNTRFLSLCRQGCAAAVRNGCVVAGLNGSGRQESAAAAAAAARPTAAAEEEAAAATTARNASTAGDGEDTDLDSEADLPTAHASARPPGTHPQPVMEVTWPLKLCGAVLGLLTLGLSCLCGAVFGHLTLGLLRVVTSGELEKCKQTLWCRARSQVTSAVLGHKSQRASRAADVWQILVLLLLLLCKLLLL